MMNYEIFTPVWVRDNLNGTAYPDVGGGVGKRSHINSIV
jgi:hypothetical protein